MSGRFLSMESLPAPMSLLSAISQRRVSNPLIYFCIRSAGINCLLSYFSRTGPGLSFSMDLLLDHISFLPDYYPLLKDDMLLAHHFHHGPLALFPTNSYCLISGLLVERTSARFISVNRISFHEHPLGYVAYTNSFTLL